MCLNEIYINIIKMKKNKIRNIAEINKLHTVEIP